MQNEVHVLFHYLGLSRIVVSEKEESVLFSPFCQSLPVDALYILHALPNQTFFFDFLFQQHKKLCHFIMMISDNINYFFSLAMTSFNPSYPTVRLAINPNL